MTDRPRITPHVATDAELEADRVARAERHAIALEWATELETSGLVRGRDFDLEGNTPRPRHGEIRWTTHWSIYDWGPRALGDHQMGEAVPAWGTMPEFKASSARYWERLRRDAASPRDDAATTQANVEWLIREARALGITEDQLRLAGEPGRYAPTFYLGGDDGGYELGRPGDRSNYQRLERSLDFAEFLTLITPHLERMADRQLDLPPHPRPGA